MVHGNWLLNIVAHPKGGVGAVLIRAVEPLQGLETMKENRKTKNVHDLTSGSGKLTRVFAITKELNGVDVTDKSPLMVIERENEIFEVCSSHRVGVKSDLPQKLRFFIKGSRFVSEV
ncbi:MAG: DNA-3-methyladenine glycosylase [Candidatus Bathyarchaeia archaeon]